MFDLDRDLSSKLALKPKIIDFIDNQTVDSGFEGICNSGTIVVSPLSKSGSTTVCNALRRVLIGEFSGYAITAFQVNDAAYEFENIDGISEDLIQIALNIKQIRLKIEGTESVTEFVSFEVQGPMVVKAGLIEERCGIAVVNKDQVICTINANINVRIRLAVSFGSGYSDSNTIKKNAIKQPGMIYLDALFNPIKRVSFRDEDVVVNGEDFKKVFFDIETDGSIDYRFAFSSACESLKEIFDSLLNCSGASHKRDSIDHVARENIFSREYDQVSGGDYLVNALGMQYNVNLFKTIHEIEMPIRAHNAFVKSNILYLGDLIKIPYKELMTMPNLGRKSLEAVAVNIQRFGLKFDMQMPSWPPIDLASLRKQYESKFNSGKKKKSSDNDW
jgi:DNA-directed RNA polymerase subunit alpha